MAASPEVALEAVRLGARHPLQAIPLGEVFGARTDSDERTQGDRSAWRARFQGLTGRSWERARALARMLCPARWDSTLLKRVRPPRRRCSRSGCTSLEARGHSDVPIGAERDGGGS